MRSLTVPCSLIAALGLVSPAGAREPATANATAGSSDAPAATDGAGTEEPATRPTPGHAEHPKDRFGDPLPMPPEPASDQRTWHLDGGASFGLAVPFGNLERNIGQRQAAGLGWTLGGDLGLGVSRYLVVAAWGDWASFSGGRCEACTTSSYGVGGQLRYYVAQGLRLDPWIALGVGYRSLTLDTPAGEGTYSGVEWLRFRVGGSWYLFDKLTLGPALGLALGSFTERPDSQLTLRGRPRGDGNTSVYARFDLALRLGFDLPGR